MVMAGGKNVTLELISISFEDGNDPEDNSYNLVTISGMAFLAGSSKAGYTQHAQSS